MGSWGLIVENEGAGVNPPERLLPHFPLPLTYRRLVSNPKHEIRNSKQIQMTEIKMSQTKNHVEMVPCRLVFPFDFQL